MSTQDIVFRELHTPEEMHEVVQLQVDTWGLADATPANQLVISVKSGGHVIGAFADGQLVAFSYGFPAYVPGSEPWIASHMLATRKDFRGQGLGRKLKWVQREWALARGFRRITWTFDPLEAANAHLNLNLLGAVVHEYIENCYGEMDDQLNRGLPSDRLMADWEITSPRVAAAKEGTLQPSEGTRLVEIPRDLQTLKAKDFGKALEVRLALREELGGLLRAGHTVVGFDRERSALVVE